MRRSERSVDTGVHLSNGVSETTIGFLLNSHPEIFKGAFKTEQFIYEATLDWQEHSGAICKSSIRPDFFIKRKDGYFDILDLKLAKIDRKSLTKGKDLRKKFVDYVYEGISQLVNYEAYFNFEKNAAYAWKKFGIKINNPRLILVVGNDENLPVEEAEKALKLHPNITIVDYDTLISLFHQSSKKATEHKT